MTAVEFLETIMPKLVYISKSNKVKFDELIKQAKEMEKEQIIEAFDEGQEYEYQYHINSAPKFDALTYYNETFKSE